uniref:Uncharacterized protein n=1 Tax=Siphoviridae sp. ctAvf12 TaxID=2826185 RepID=A0A8S5QLK6_9CAUD|nr:MAG TPA: hypothetical protein [Siphoviridae sp. ctAvf12]
MEPSPFSALGGSFFVFPGPRPRHGTGRERPRGWLSESRGATVPPRGWDPRVLPERQHPR